jgi:hypothetical protein
MRLFGIVAGSLVLGVAILAGLVALAGVTTAAAQGVAAGLAYTMLIAAGGLGVACAASKTGN